MQILFVEEFRHESPQEATHPGTRTFLVELLAQRQTFMPELERRVSDMELLSSFDVDHIKTDALLFQTGCLTLQGAQEILPGEWVYTLGYPNREVRSNPIANYEGYYDYAGVFYSHFVVLGLDIRLGDVTNHGRIDMSVLFNGNLYLFEFKVVERVPEGRALQQIKDIYYNDKYIARGEPIHLIGVEFSREQRSVVGFEAETLAVAR